MTPNRPPRYRVIVYELRDGKTTQVIDVYGSGFITAVATTSTATISTSTSEPADPATSKPTSPPPSPTSTHPAEGDNALPTDELPLSGEAVA